MERGMCILLLLLCLVQHQTAADSLVLEGERADEGEEERFSCHGRVAGYYADMSADCRGYFMCSHKGAGGLRFSCPAGTSFQQSSMVCDHSSQVKCEQSPEYFHYNRRIGLQHVKFLDPPGSGSKDARRPSSQTNGPKSRSSQPGEEGEQQLKSADSSSSESQINWTRQAEQARRQAKKQRLVEKAEQTEKRPEKETSGAATSESSQAGANQLIQFIPQFLVPPPPPPPPATTETLPPPFSTPSPASSRPPPAPSQALLPPPLLPQKQSSSLVSSTLPSLQDSNAALEGRIFAELATPPHRVQEKSPLEVVFQLDRQEQQQRLPNQTPGQQQELLHKLAHLEQQQQQQLQEEPIAARAHQSLQDVVESSKAHKHSKDSYQRKLAHKLRGRKYLHLEAPPPGAAVACWSLLATATDVSTAGSPSAVHASTDQKALGTESAVQQKASESADSRREQQQEGGERSGKSILLKPRGPAQGFFNRDKLEQFSFFLKTQTEPPIPVLHFGFRPLASSSPRPEPENSDAPVAASDNRRRKVEDLQRLAEEGGSLVRKDNQLKRSFKDDQAAASKSILDFLGIFDTRKFFYIPSERRTDEDGESEGILDHITRWWAGTAKTNP